MRTLAQLAERPQIALFDIETAPALGWVWGKYEQDVIEFEQQSYMLCFSVKWLNSPRVETYSLPDFPTWKRDKRNDKELVMKLWQMMGEADIIVAHNGDNFDLKYTRGRMIVHGLSPPEESKTVDTLKLARKHFKFPSNKLDDIGRDLGVGRKLPHTGFHLWLGCMRGDKASWDLMRRYNKQDVLLLERVYLRFRPWSAHPNVNLYQDDPAPTACPKCGATRIRRKGKHYTNTQIYKRYLCLECHGWFKGENLKKDE